MDQFLQLPRDERNLYFVQTAERLRLSPQIVEKDFWVCWTLQALFALPGLGASLIFKGGTSLSKVYRLIERFSEDIDVSIERASLGFGGDQDPAAAASAKERGRRIGRLKAACQRTVVEDVQPALATVIAAAGGEEGDWSLRLDADDPDRQTLLFAYPARMPASARAYLRPVVRLELGARSDHWPSAQAPITPYVAQAFPAAFRAPAVAVKVLAVTRTFREKATLLHAEYHRSPAKPIPPRLSRHYYDLARGRAGRRRPGVAPARGRPQDRVLLERMGPLCRGASGEPATHAGVRAHPGPRGGLRQHAGDVLRRAPGISRGATHPRGVGRAVQSGSVKTRIGSPPEEVAPSMRIGPL
jgi:hypothetical protein